MLYNIVLVSATQQHASATGTRASPPSRASLPPPAPSRPSRLPLPAVAECWGELPTSHGRFLLAGRLTHGSAHVSMLLSQFVPPSHLWRRQWHPTPVLLPEKSHGWRDCSPWDRGESDTTVNFTFTFHFHVLEKEMATHSSVLAWRIPGTGEPGGLLSLGSHRVRHD